MLATVITCTVSNLDNHAWKSCLRKVWGPCYLIKILTCCCEFSKQNTLEYCSLNEIWKGEKWPYCATCLPSKHGCCYSHFSLLQRLLEGKWTKRAKRITFCSYVACLAFILILNQHRIKVPTDQSQNIKQSDKSHIKGTGIWNQGNKYFFSRFHLNELFSHLWFTSTVLWPQI